MSSKHRAGHDPIASGHGGLDFEVCLDVGEEADDRNVAEVRVVFDLADRLHRVARRGIKVNDQEGRLVRQGSGDDLILTPREEERDAELARGLADFAREEQVIYRD